jgi:hypothetical protein
MQNGTRVRSQNWSGRGCASASPKLFPEVIRWAMASTTLSLFWNLSSNSEEDRLDASVKLISALETFQAKHTPSSASGESSNDEAEDEEEGALQRKATKDNLEANNAPDVAYSIRRLIRGLASPRESSRLGFAVALTEVRLPSCRDTLAAHVHLQAALPNQLGLMLSSSLPHYRRIHVPRIYVWPRRARRTVR